MDDEAAHLAGLVGEEGAGGGAREADHGPAGHELLAGVPAPVGGESVCSEQDTKQGSGRTAGAGGAPAAAGGGQEGAAEVAAALEEGEGDEAGGDDGVTDVIGAVGAEQHLAGAPPVGVFGMPADDVADRASEAAVFGDEVEADLNEARRIALDEGGAGQGGEPDGGLEAGAGVVEDGIAPSEGGGEGRVAGGKHAPEIGAGECAERFAEGVIVDAGDRGRDIAAEVGAGVGELAVGLGEVAEPGADEVVGGEPGTDALEGPEPDELEVGAFAGGRGSRGEGLGIAGQVLDLPLSVGGRSEGGADEFPKPGAVDLVAVVGLCQCDHWVVSPRRFYHTGRGEGREMARREAGVGTPALQTKGRGGGWRLVNSCMRRFISWETVARLSWKRGQRCAPEKR